jgi:NADH-quinone oxidoreductase subunit E
MMERPTRAVRGDDKRSDAMPRRVTQTPQAEPGAPDLGLDLSEVGRVVGEIDPHGNLIAVLQHVQAHYGYLPEPVVDEIARLSGVPASRIYGIVTFYAQFSTEPSGRHKVFVCHGTACHVAGAPRITEALEQELGVPDGGTTPDMSFTLDSVACMGACSQAPVMRIDADTFGNLTPDSTRKFIVDVLSELGLSAADLRADGGVPDGGVPDGGVPNAAAPDSAATGAAAAAGDTGAEPVHTRKDGSHE